MMKRPNFVLGGLTALALLALALGGGRALAAAATPAPAATVSPSAPVTALSGLVLTTDGAPIENVALRDGTAATRTDANGRFTLANVTLGASILAIDGRHAGVQSQTDYGYYEARVTAVAGRTTALPFISYLPRIDHAHEIAITSPTPSEVVLTTPAIPGLEVHIPAGSVITDVDGKPVKKISITPIPTDRTPFPLPQNVYVPIWFTVQPGGARISGANGSWPGGAQVYYPNYHNDLPGARGAFWRYDPSDHGWTIYGTGKISSDRRQMVPDAKTRIYDFAGFMFDGNMDGVPPADGPNAGAPAGAPNGPPGARGNPDGGEPVDFSTGLFVHAQTDLRLADIIPLALTRTYRQNDFNQRSFGVGMTLNYEMYLWSAQQYQQVDLVMADGGRVHFTRIPNVPYSNGWTDAVFTTNVPGPFFNSHISWVNTGWNLVTQDGTLYRFGELAPLQYIQDRFGNRVTMVRAGGPNTPITQVTSSDGRFIKFTYDSSNRITQAEDNVGRTVSYVYDSDGRLQTVTDPNDGVTTYTWDSNNRVSSIKDAAGNVIVNNAYDGNGRVETQTLADGSTYQFAYTLDDNGNVTETDVTDPLGTVRKVTFNASQYWLTDQLAYGTAQEQDYSVTRDATTNLPLSMTDGLGRQTTWTYDANANTTSVTRLAGTSNAVTTGYTYTAAYNQLATVTDPLGNTTTFQRDSLDRLTAIVDPLGNTTSYTYNAQGQPLTVTDALSHTTRFAYDHGDLVSVTDPLGHTTTRYTDVLGRTARLTDPLGDQINLVHDPIDGVHQVIDPTGATTTTNYNAVGWISSIVDARGATTGYTYDSRGRVTVRTDPLSQTDNFTSYDGNGNLLTATDRNGQQVTYTYDALNRPLTASYADGSSVTYTWDNGNRLTQIQDSVAGTITRAYDGLDRLTSETSPQGTVSYTYDADGRPARMSVTGQADVVYTFDNASRLTQITQGSAAVSIGYDNDNRRTSLTLPNGITASYGYDAASELTGITYGNGSGTVGTLTYAYDAAGHLASRGGTLFQSVLPAAVTSASYDADNRLTQWLTAGGGITPTYNNDGNLTSDGTNTYSWDARNRLTSISSGASFAYDGLGRRQSTTLAGTSKSYLYDGADVVQEQTGSSPSASLLTGLGIDERFIRTTASGTSTYLPDLLGTTAALTDGTGTVQTSYGYDPFGNTSALGAANDNAFQFTGRENDGTGLYFYRGRYYNPVWGRFISEDPIGLAGGANLYEYASNNSLQLRDPTGLSPTSELAAIAQALGEWLHRNDPPSPENPGSVSANAASPPASMGNYPAASGGSGSDGEGGAEVPSPLNQATGADDIYSYLSSSLLNEFDPTDLMMNGGGAQNGSSLLQADAGNAPVSPCGNCTPVNRNGRPIGPIIKPGTIRVPGFRFPYICVECAINQGIYTPGEAPGKME